LAYCNIVYDLHNNNLFWLPILEQNKK